MLLVQELEIINADLTEVSIPFEATRLFFFSILRGLSCKKRETIWFICSQVAITTSDLHLEDLHQQTRLVGPQWWAEPKFKGPPENLSTGLEGEALKIPSDHKRGAEVGRHGDDLRRPPLVKAAPLICECEVILVAAALGSNPLRVLELRRQKAVLKVT